MSYKLVCVGGTGQMVLHYYLQLYLLGVIRHEFDVVVIDSDEIIPSVKIVQDLLKGLQYGSLKNEGFGRTSIPVIESIWAKPTSGDTALEALTGQKNWKETTTHSAHAYFDKDTLSQNLKQGLFARPALSTVLSQELFTNKHLAPDPNSTVIIVGAVTGGTGGGLTAPVLDAIRMFTRVQKIENVKIRAVLFGEYFRPLPGLIDNDAVRFQSNQTMVLRSFSEAEASEDLHSYCIVGGPGFNADFERQPASEKSGKNITWPKNEANPFWQGIQALEYLFTDSAMQKVTNFGGREVQTFAPQFSLAAAQLRLRKSVQMIRMLIDKRAVIRLCEDPWSRWIWGSHLVEIVSHFWNIAATKEGGKEAVRGFPEEVSNGLNDLWRGEGKELGLQDIFPIVSEPERMRPGKMARIRWPAARQGVLESKLFDDSKEVARRAATILLFWTLREVI